MSTFVLRRERPETAKAIAERAMNAARELYRDGDVEIRVQRHKRQRTNQQNAYFWALVGLIEDETGEDKETIKIRLMHALGHVRQVYSQGEYVLVAKSTTTLGTREFGELINATQSLCQQLGIRYPLPAEYGYDW